ncbi:carboxymuconolactone decarboxylase family protein [bacterium]|nr:carboxymuconolactone decarboxylase family protein [bacterium]
MSEEKLPKTFTRFKEQFPEIAEVYEELTQKSLDSGPLDFKTARLIKLALSVGGRLEGAVHADVKKALKAGATPEEIFQVGVLAITSIGFPSAMASLSWMRNIFEELNIKGTKNEK